MKKIVALVLSLVMALSLCTVAFGAIGVKDVVYDLDGTKTPVKSTVLWDASDLTTVKAHTAKYPELSNVEYYVAPAYIACYILVDADDADVEVYVSKAYWDADGGAAYAEYLAGGEYTLKTVNGEAAVTYAKYADHNDDAVSYLIPCDRDDANVVLYENGDWSQWLMIADKSEAFYDYTATAQKATKDLPNCTTTQFLEDGYVDADGCCFFVADENGKVKLNVDGKIIRATLKNGDTDYVIWASHVFAKGVKNDKTGYDVATCLVCKSEFACTDSEEVASKNGYKISTMFEYSSAEASDVYEANKYANGYDFKWGQTYAGNYKFCWQLKAGTTEEIGTADKTETTTTTTGVESAKTFDAGIAMYVGMSLMSVAGTAVVIGKKKEF